jgi:hypothetical protein
MQLTISEVEKSVDSEVARLFPPLDPADFAMSGQFAFEKESYSRRAHMRQFRRSQTALLLHIPLERVPFQD